MKSRIKEDGTLITGKVKFIYTSVFNFAKSIDGEVTDKYSVCIIIDKEDTETIANIKMAINDTLTYKFKGKNKPTSKQAMSIFHDGDEDKLNKKDYAHFKGKYYINASTKIKPKVIDNQKATIYDDNGFGDGSVGYASLVFYPYEVKVKSGIGCGLRNILVTDNSDRIQNYNNDDFADFEFIDNDDDDNDFIPF